MTTRINQKNFLDPKTVALISNYEILAKGIVDGYFAGENKGPRTAFSLEYSKHREYYAGDPLRLVDWKLFGKTDRFFVKQFEEETNLEAWLLMDISQSMAYAGEKSPVSKLQYASYLAAALSYLLLSQNNLVGMILFDEKIRKIIRPSSARRQFYSLIRELQNLKPGTQSNFETSARMAAGRIKKRGMLILFSDLLTRPERAVWALKHFLCHHSELVVFHILTHEELRFPFKTFGHFEDMETNDRVLLQPALYREEYLKRIQHYLESLRRGCLELGVQYELLETTTHFDQALTQFLQARKKVLA